MWDKKGPWVSRQQRRGPDDCRDEEREEAEMTLGAQDAGNGQEKEPFVQEKSSVTLRLPPNLSL